MSSKTAVSVLVLAYNEKIHLGKLLNHLQGWADQIVIVDSFSSDGTAEIAKQANCDVLEHSYEYHSQQLNWALENASFRNNWILVLDADEWLTDELKAEIKVAVTQAADGVNGYMFKRRIYFQNKWIKNGGCYPFWVVRLFRQGFGFSENIKMDEKFIVKGKVEKLRADLVDENLKGISFWVQKHNTYAQREADDVLNGQRKPSRELLREAKEMKSVRRFFKHFYYKLPIFLRAGLYFLFRYFFLLGFLDGKEGLIFHSIQGGWYRFLVDVYIHEAKRKEK